MARIVPELGLSDRARRPPSPHGEGGQGESTGPYREEVRPPMQEGRPQVLEPLYPLLLRARCAARAGRQAQADLVQGVHHAQGRGGRGARGTQPPGPGDRPQHREADGARVHGPLARPHGRPRPRRADPHALPTIGGLQLKALEAIHLSDLYAKLLREGRRDGKPGGLAPAHGCHVHRALHRMLKQAVRWNFIAQNPATDLELASVPKVEMVTLSREQAGALLRAAEPRPLMRALVMLGVATGARLGELLALCWTDVDLDAGIVRIGWSRRIVKGRMQVKGPKTDAGYRPVVLGPRTLAALKRLHAEQLERRLALGPDYHPDAERRLASSSAHGDW